MKKAVKVCVRTRPTQNFAQGNLLIEQAENCITCQVYNIIIIIDNSNDYYYYLKNYSLSREMMSHQVVYQIIDKIVLNISLIMFFIMLVNQKYMTYMLVMLFKVLQMVLMVVL